MDRDRQIALGERFRALHQNPGMVVLPNAWDVASAILLARAGFPAIATTSAGIGYTAGYPVGEAMPLDAMLSDVARMADRLNIPLSADMESGYGITGEEVSSTVRQTIEAGAVGINIEDTDHRHPGTLFDFDLAVERIAAARAAADETGIPFVLNARTDGYWHGGDTASVHDEVVRRANAFMAAGADCIFVPGNMDLETITRVAADIDGPLNIMGGAACPPVPELEAAGVKRVTVGAIMARAAFATLETAAAELRDDGTFGFAKGILSHAALNDTMSDE